MRLLSFTVRLEGSDRHGREGDPPAEATFETLDEAVGAAKRIVDAYLEGAYQPGMSARQLWQSYAMYGVSPFITSEELTTSPFSAWSYASNRIRSWRVEEASGARGPAPEELPR